MTLGELGSPGTVTYLEHNPARMNYPAYRCQGLPVSTSMIESLIKEINDRQSK